MFTEKELKNIDREYFKVIAVSTFAVTLESRNTRHQWHLISKECRTGMSCEVHHRHDPSKPWHPQWGSKRFPDVLDDIRWHDEFAQKKETR